MKNDVYKMIFVITCFVAALCGCTGDEVTDHHLPVIYKKLFAIILLLIFVPLEVCSQNKNSLQECTTVEDSAKFIRHIFVDNKHNFIGKKADVVFSAYSEYLPVRCTIPCESSLFVDMEGKSYITGVKIYYKDVWTIRTDVENDVKHFYLRINLEDTHLDADFWRRLPKEDRRHLYHLRDFIVKDVKLILVDPKKLKARGNL